SDLTAPAMVGGIMMIGFFKMLATCNMEVPIPWAINPPTPFSRKLDTPNPTICAAQPTQAAPAARPSSESIMEIAKLEIGAVKAQPISTATNIPIMIGCCAVDQLMISPNQTINALIGGPMKVPVKNPAKMVINGVTIISTRVV